MSETATSHAVAGLWTALQKTDLAGSGRGMERICREAVATGWAGYTRVETLIDDIAPAILSIAAPSALTIRLLLATFEVPLQEIFRRPRSEDEGGVGIEAVSAINLAHLLIKLEATGFAIDPAPVCAMLRPNLRTREHLTLPEIAVWLHAKERHRSGPRIIATGPLATWGSRSEWLTTPSGYRAELFRGADGEPTALVVMAPKRRALAA